MLERLLVALKLRQPDPTEGWPRLPVKTPDINSHGATVGQMRFGDNLASAQPFGRPDGFRWIRPNYCELVYGAAGFQIDFDSDRFAYAGFFIASDPCQPVISSLSFAEPRLDGILLTGETSVKQVESTFGQPDSRDTDEEETVFFYTRGGLTVEFEFAPSVLLKRLNVYPNKVN